VLRKRARFAAESAAHGMRLTAAAPANRAVDRRAEPQEPSEQFPRLVKWRKAKVSVSREFSHSNKHRTAKRPQHDTPYCCGGVEGLAFFAASCYFSLASLAAFSFSTLTIEPSMALTCTSVMSFCPVALISKE